MATGVLGLAPKKDEVATCPAMRRYIGALILALMYSTGVQTAWAMGNHSDVVRDQYGRALGGTTITVYVAGTTDLADIYSDNGVTAKDNPFTSDTLDGRYNFYAANGVYDLVLSHPNATFDAAHTARISVIDASAVTGGSSTPVGLDDAFTVDPEITTATSANPMKVGNGTQKLELLGDATMGGVIRPSPLGDSAWRIWTNFNGVIRDEEAGATMFTIDPDAASKNAMYQFGTNYKPLATIHVPLNPRGAATGAYESIVSNQPNDYYLTVTDANTDAADFTFFVTPKMAGATTATFRLVGVSKNASPSGNIDLDCAISTFTPGTDTYTAHVTTGEVTALLTPVTKNRPVAVTTASHPINGGALVAGDIVKGSCEVDASATTSAQMSDFRLEGTIAITLEVNSLSE